MSRQRNVSFKINRTESLLIGRIVERVVAIRRKHHITTSNGEAQTIHMDLTATHANGNPLNLERMLSWKRDEDIIHDVMGINRHLDRATGQLRDHFLPRFTDMARMKHNA